MYSHDNLTYSTLITYLNFEYEWDTHSVVSYLPMGHLASIMLDIFLMMKSGGTTYCADRNASRGTLVGQVTFLPISILPKYNLNSFRWTT